jgi:hypothetical protein
MNPAAPIPADRLLDQVIVALIAADAAALRQLEVAAPTVLAPRNCAHYLHQHAACSVLLHASARNLRLLSRAIGGNGAHPYTSSRP